MIKLICSYPYDNNYDYIKLFTTKEEQKIYFNNLKTITEIEYSEENEQGYIKEGDSFCVAYNYDYLVSEGVNYVLFNNGYKDIYAFITSKEFLNEELTRLNYEIDVLQTFLFDINLNKSFIERKKCTINEITEFDEGLNIGEHIIQNSYNVFNKDSVYFAMFNGIKEQQLIYNDKGKVQNVINLPFPTSKPLTTVDGVQYPLYFMPLKENYKAPSYSQIPPPTGGEIPGGNGSDVVTSARKLLGKPYVWGGNYPPLGNSNGTDCSGLIMWAFNDCGLLTDVGLGGRWTTYTMIEHATYIKDPSMAKVGDVIFSNFNENKYPEHVALISNIEYNNITIIEAQQEGVPILERTIGWDNTKYEIRRMM